MMAMSGMRPAPMAADVPAAMQAAIAMPAMMTTTVPVPVAVTTPDLEQVGSSLDMFGSGRSRVCRAGGREGKGGDSGPGDCAYFHRNSFGLIAPDNGTEPIWFPPAPEG